MRLLFLLCMLALGVPSSPAGATSGWQTFTFDGKGFVSGSGSGTLRTRDGYLPTATGASVQREDQLPEGTGAIAVFCYQQRSGGKLRSHSAFLPLSGIAITVQGKSVTLAGRSDDSGYLILALPPGSYRLQFAGLSKTVTVEKGKTSLAAFRGSKGMVD